MWVEVNVDEAIQQGWRWKCSGVTWTESEINWASSSSAPSKFVDTQLSTCHRSCRQSHSWSSPYSYRRQLSVLSFISPMSFSDFDDESELTSLTSSEDEFAPVKKKSKTLAKPKDALLHALRPPRTCQYSARWLYGMSRASMVLLSERVCRLSRIRANHRQFHQPQSRLSAR